MPTATVPDTPSPLQRQLAHGFGLLRQHRYAEAVRLARQLLQLHPDDVNVLLLGTDAMLATGNPRQSLALAERALARSGGDPSVKLRKARVLAAMRRRRELRDIVAEVRAMAGGNGELLWHAGSLCFRNDLVAEAIACLADAARLLDHPPALLYELAFSRFYGGDFAAAEADLDRLLARDPGCGSALYLRACVRRQTPERNNVADLRQRLQGSTSARPNDRAAALYALAKELEDLGQDAASFQALEEGARLMRGTFEFDVAAECAGMAEMAEAYDAAFMAAPTPGHQEAGPVFVVGMPRSGTTLVERLLVQSGQVVSAGEPQDFGHLLLYNSARMRGADTTRTLAQASTGLDLAAIGREYMRGLREIVPGSTLFIDKMPANFMFCGAILKALPEARIIHLVRDPLDSCYAMYKTLFFNMYPFSYDQAELAGYFVGYRRLMAHWHQVAPGRILDVHYEELVTDTEAQARRLYEWCGLPWTERALETPGADKVFVTASAAQVREPVHRRSVGSALRHRESLSVLAARLAAAPELGWSLPAMAD